VSVSDVWNLSKNSLAFHSYISLNTGVFFLQRINSTNNNKTQNNEN